MNVLDLHFAYPCQEQTTEPVTAYLNNLILIFGMPSFIHSHRRAASMVDALKAYMTEKRIAQNRTTPYNPTGISQCEKFNDIILKNIQIAT